jgi:hypothetical protein
LSSDDTLPPAQEQSSETASNDVKKRRITSPPFAILHPQKHIVILSAVEGRQCGEAG